MPNARLKSDTIFAEPLSPGKSLVELVRAAVEGDQVILRQKISSLAQSYAGVDESEVRQELIKFLRRPLQEVRPLSSSTRLPVDAKSRMPLIQQTELPKDPLLVPDELGEELLLILDEFAHSQKLANVGLATNNTLLLCGPPGTGKTHLARHIAQQLGRPLHTARLDSMISSLLGDTAKNIRALFDHAHGSEIVLFLDEIDALGKQRDDSKELGELKRVVNTLLQGLDQLSVNCVVIGATNHPDLLDPALWRRFTHHLDINLPDLKLRNHLWAHYLFDQPVPNRQSEALSRSTNGLSCSDIRELALAARRRSVITDQPIQMAQIARAVLRSSNGVIKRPAAGDLSQTEINQLAHELFALKGVRQADIVQLLNITKQRVSIILQKKKSLT